MLLNMFSNINPFSKSYIYIHMSLFYRLTVCGSSFSPSFFYTPVSFAQTETSIQYFLQIQRMIEHKIVSMPFKYRGFPFYNSLRNIEINVFLHKKLSDQYIRLLLLSHLSFTKIHTPSSSSSNVSLKYRSSRFVIDDAIFQHLDPLARDNDVRRKTHTYEI